MKASRTYILTGFFVTVGITLFIFFSFFAGKYQLLQGGVYYIQVEYDFLDNLKSGAKVKVAGGPVVGKVEEIIFTNGKLVTLLSVENDYKINRGADFSIYSTSLVGEKYINIGRYNPNTNEFYTNNEYLLGVPTMGYSRLLEKAGDTLDYMTPEGSVKMMNNLQSAFNNSVRLIESLNKMVDDNQANVSQTIEDLGKSLEVFDSVNRVIKSNEKGIYEGIASLNKSLELFESVNEMIEENKDDINESIDIFKTSLEGSEQVMNDLNQASKHLDEAALSFRQAGNTLNTKVESIDEQKINEVLNQSALLAVELNRFTLQIQELYDDTNSVVQLAQDPEFRKNVETIVTNLRDFSETFKEKGILRY